MGERPENVSGPEYAGSADPGLRSSVADEHPARGDVAAFVAAEHDKLESLLGTMVALAEQGPREQLEQRWYGVVRELLEFETAQERVVAPEVPEDAELARSRSALLDRLRGEDELLDRSVDPRDVVDLARRAAEHVRLERERLVPALSGLPDDVRWRLGEDLRQTMG